MGNDMIDKEKLIDRLKEMHKGQKANRDQCLKGELRWEYFEGASDYLQVVINIIQSGEFNLY